MKNLKKIVAVTLMLVAFCATTLAAPAGFKDRLVFVGSSNASDREELNYYLDNGGSLISFQVVPRNNSQNIACYVHVIYPKDLPVWKRGMK